MSSLVKKVHDGSDALDDFNILNKKMKSELKLNYSLPVKANGGELDTFVHQMKEEGDGPDDSASMKKGEERGECLRYSSPDVYMDNIRKRYKLDKEWVKQLPAELEHLINLLELYIVSH